LFLVNATQVIPSRSILRRDFQRLLVQGDGLLPGLRGLLLLQVAVVFGLLGAFLLYAAFRPGYQLAGLIAGFVSVLSFLYLAWSTGGYNAQLGRVFTADIVALVCLIVAAAAYAYLPHER
jgi:hypothetical protein